MQHGAILKALLGYNNSNMALKQGGHRTAEMVTNDTKMGWNYNAFIAGLERGRGLGATAREKREGDFRPG